jgi:predicted permease
MLRDLRIAVRALRTWRWGALLAVLTLAVGIGTTTALYALLRVALAENAVEIDEVERVIRIYGVNPAFGARRSPVAFDDFDALQSGVRSFESVAAYHGAEMTVGTGTETDTAKVMLVSPRFFDVMRGRAIEGRLFTPADRAYDAPTAVVSEIAWRRRFAGRRIADAPTIRLDDRDYVVVGVLPASFSYSMIGITADVWLPLTRRAADGARVSVISRLAPGVSWTLAAGELSTLAAPNHPETGWRWGGIPVQQDVRARTGGGTVLIFFPAAVVLLIGCVNVACMLMARGMRRDTELSVRMALGASRGAIFRQLLLENSLLALAAGILGTALASAGLDVVVRMVIDWKPEVAGTLSGDLGLLPIALTSSIVACLLFGVVPALRLSRRDVASSLKGSAPAARVRVAGYGARDLVVFVELALASVLVVMTAMAFAIFGILQGIEFGFAVNELIDVRVPARDAAAAADRLRAIGGVASVAISTHPPGEGGAAGTASSPGRTSGVRIVDAGQGFFETSGMAIVRGRTFLSEEAAGSAVAIVSEAAAAALWPGEDPLGRPVDVNLRGRSTRLVVVGVARDELRMALPRPAPGKVYRPLDLAACKEATLLVRSPRATQIARAVTDAVQARDQAAAVHVRVLRGPGREIAQSGKMLRLFGALASIALLLAASGIFAVVSQSVTQRTPEFGVRLALGATPWKVLRTVLNRELKLIVAALATGTIGTIAMTRSSGFDDAAFIVAVNMSRPEWGIGLIGLCGAVAGLACLLATYRIVKLDPSVVLRRL